MVGGQCSVLAYGGKLKPLHPVGKKLNTEQCLQLYNYLRHLQTQFCHVHEQEIENTATCN